MFEILVQTLIYVTLTLITFWIGVFKTEGGSKKTFWCFLDAKYLRRRRVGGACTFRTRKLIIRFKTDLCCWDAGSFFFAVIFHIFALTWMVCLVLNSWRLHFYRCHYCLVHSKSYWQVASISLLAWEEGWLSNLFWFLTMSSVLL